MAVQSTTGSECSKSQVRSEFASERSTCRSPHLFPFDIGPEVTLEANPVGLSGNLTLLRENVLPMVSQARTHAGARGRDALQRAAGCMNY